MTGTFTSPTVAVSGTIPTATLAILASGNHTIYVRGQDSNGTWSSFISVTLNLDKTGPASTGLALSLNPSNGAVSVALTATGNSNVTAAQYWVDGGAHIAMTTLGAASPVRSLSATIPAGLAQGTHIVSVQSQDAFGNLGAISTINLVVSDTVAPTTSGLSASPSPNNGSLPFNTSTPAIRVFASFSDVATGNSNIAAAEGFLDTIGTTGTGFVFIANDGLFNSPAEGGYADIPLPVIGTLTEGNHTIYVHAKDAAGSWGAMATTILVIDRTPPTVVSITRVTASPTNAASVQFLVTFSESVTGVASSNFMLAPTGVTGASITSVSTGPGATRTVTVNTGSGSGTIRLNMVNGTGIADLATNALTGTFPINGPTYTIDKTAPTFTGVTINPTSITAGTASVTMAVAGSVDTGGSGLANAGEYWFDTASITPGTGTAFTGTSGISVATSTLTVGSHTLRVRIRDNAGNWSTVQTAPLTVTSNLNHPTVSKIFAGAVRGGNGSQAQRTTTLTITLSNSNAVALTGATLTDNLPQPVTGTLTVVGTPTTTCGGTVSTANTNRRLLLTSGIIPANSSCTVTATVRISAGATNGPYTLTNTIAVGGLTTTNGGSNLVATSAVLTVNP